MSTFYEAGMYVGEVTSQGITKAHTGTPQFVLKFRVLSYANGDAVPAQYERTIWRSITDKTIPYFKRDLEALGFQGDSLKQLDPSFGDYVDFKGVKTLFSCQHERAPGGDIRERWSVTWAKEETPITGEALGASEYRKLDALFGASKKQEPKPAQPAARVTRQAQAVVTRETTVVTDEDIPF